MGRCHAPQTTDNKKSNKKEQNTTPIQHNIHDDNTNDDSSNLVRECFLCSLWFTVLLTASLFFVYLLASAVLVVIVIPCYLRLLVYVLAPPVFLRWWC